MLKNNEKNKIESYKNNEIKVEDNTVEKNKEINKDVKKIGLNYIIDNLKAKTNVAMLLPIAIFLPYKIAIVAIIVLAIYVISNVQIRSSILSNHNFRALALFFMYGIGTSVYHGNWIGMGAGIGFLLAYIIGQHLRTIVTEVIFEKGLTLIALLSVIASVWAICEMYVIPYITGGKSVNRASAMFFYPNYFGTIVSIVVLICFYKLLIKQGNPVMYCGIIAMNIISLYLCKSMFAWIEIFVGCTLLLFVLKKYKLLTAWIGAALVGGFLILGMNLELIPRLSEAKLTTELRYGIWSYALKDIGRHMVYGTGFMPYMHIDTKQHMGFLVTHSHSIILEVLMSVGIVGTIIIGYYIFTYGRDLLQALKSKKESKVYALIIAVLGASIVHGIADLTLMWVQTLPLFIFIVSGIGVYEKETTAKVNISLLRSITINMNQGIDLLPVPRYDRTIYKKATLEIKKAIVKEALREKLLSSQS